MPMLTPSTSSRLSRSTPAILEASSWMSAAKSEGPEPDLTELRETSGIFLRAYSPFSCSFQRRPSL